MTDENEFRSCFAQLREADRGRAPTFAQIYERARMRRSLHTTRRVRPLVIGVAAAVAIAAVALSYARSSSSSAGTLEITTWRAPTDVLLRTPGSELLGEMPALGASVLDTMIPKPSNRGT